MAGIAVGASVAIHVRPNEIGFGLQIEVRYGEKIEYFNTCLPSKFITPPTPSGIGRIGTKGVFYFGPNVFK